MHRDSWSREVKVLVILRN